MFLRFWPILLPLVVYILWIAYCRRKARRMGHPVPAFRDGPWVWAVTASLLLAIGGFLWLGFTPDTQDGTYIPAHREDGRLVPARVVPHETAD